MKNKGFIAIAGLIIAAVALGGFVAIEKVRHQDATGSLGDGTGLGTLPTFNVISNVIVPRSNTWSFKIPSLVNCNTIDTDSNGLFSCGTDATGGGSGGGTLQTRSGFSGAFNTTGSASFNAAHFAYSYLSPEAKISIDWGAGGPASLSQAETISGNWVNTANPWADNEVVDGLTINGGSIGSNTLSSGATFTGSATVSANFELGGYASIGGNVFLKSGNKIDWSSGDVTITHAANLLTFDGAAEYDFNGDIITFGGRVIGGTGIGVLDDVDGSHAMNIRELSDLTADRNLDFVTGDASRIVTVSGDTTISQNYSTSGAPQFAGLTLTGGLFGTTASLSGNLEVGGFASASKYFSAGLATCGDSGHALSWTGGVFGCQAITGTADGTNSNIAFLTIGNTSSLSFERSLTATSPLVFTDNGVNSTYNLGLAAGYDIALTASHTAWEAFRDTPSTRITAGTNLSWSGNTLNATGGSGVQIPTVVVAPSGGDATTIQAGINLASSSYPDGAVVFLASRSFTITQSIRIPSNVQLVGNGRGTIINFDGNSVTPAVKGKTTSTDSIAIRHISFQQTNGTVKGTAIDGSNIVLGQYEDIAIYAASLSMDFSDSNNYTFYNSVRNIAAYDGNGCIRIDGSTPTNDNSFYDIRCAVSAGAGHYGVKIRKGQTNIFYNLNVEPGTGTNVTGLLINPSVLGDVEDTQFYGFYAEANATNVSINANAQRTAFHGGQACCALTTNISDAGVDTSFLNFDNDFGAQLTQFGMFTAIDGGSAGATTLFKNNTGFAHINSSLVKLNFLNTSDTSRLLWLKDLGQTSTALSVSSGATTGTVASISAALLTTGTGLKIEVPNSGFSGLPLLVTRLGGSMLASLSAAGNLELAGFASVSSLFTVPTNSALTQNGQLAVDNDGFGQFAYRASGSDHILTDEKTTTVSIGSTSFATWGSKSLGYQFRGGTIKRITCRAKNATSIVLRISRNGTTDMDSITCGTTRTWDDGSIANATFLKGDTLYIEKGTVSGEVDNVDLTYTYAQTRE